MSFSNIVSNREVSRSEAETDRRESFRITQSIPEGVLDLEGFLKLRRGVASEIWVGFRVPRRGGRTLLIFGWGSGGPEVVPRDGRIGVFGGPRGYPRGLT